MAGNDLDFVHLFVAPSQPDSNVMLLLLHGTGGDERDLLAIGQELLPGAAMLSPRGKVLENGMPRFFRRIAEGIFDMADLKMRTDELAEFVNAAARKYAQQNAKIIAVGYSNGANIAASMLFAHPGVLSGAVLFRPMVPFRPQSAPDLSEVAVLLAAGQRDGIVPPQQTAALAEILEEAGARVSIHWHNGGHELGEDDMAAAREWLAQEAPLKRSTT